MSHRKRKKEVRMRGKKRRKKKRLITNMSGFLNRSKKMKLKKSPSWEKRTQNLTVISKVQYKIIIGPKLLPLDLLSMLSNLK